MRRISQRLAEQAFGRRGIAQSRGRAPQVPAHGAKNHLGLRLPPLEDRRPDCLLHDLFKLPGAGQSCTTTSGSANAMLAAQLLDRHPSFRFIENSHHLGLRKARLPHREPPVPSCQKILLLDGVFSWEAYARPAVSLSTLWVTGLGRSHALDRRGSCSFRRTSRLIAFTDRFIEFRRTSLDRLERLSGPQSRRHIQNGMSSSSLSFSGAKYERSLNSPINLSN